MQSYKSSWSIIRPLLEEKLKSSGKSAHEIASIAGMSYWSASRALREGLKNYNKRAELLCKHFNVRLESQSEKRELQLKALQHLVASVWDGTEAHAELLMDLIKSTGSYKIEQR